VISVHIRFVHIFAGVYCRGRRTEVEPVNLVIIHIMQHHLSHILRCMAICNIIYIIMKASDTKTDDLEST